MNEDIGKKMFLEYAGDPYFMERDGVLERYRALGVPRDTERCWAKEYEDNLLSHFAEAGVADQQLRTLFGLIRDFQDFQALSRLISLIVQKVSTIDTFTKIRISEEVMEITPSLTADSDLAKGTIRNAERLALDLLCSAHDEPITVSSCYKDIGYLNDVLDDESIRRRISKLMGDIRGRGRTTTSD